MKKAPQIKRFGFKENNSYKRVAKYFETRYKVISLHEASGACFDCAMSACKMLICFLFFSKRIQVMRVSQSFYFWHFTRTGGLSVR